MDFGTIGLIVLLIICIIVLIVATVFIDKARKATNVSNGDSNLNNAYSKLKTAFIIAIIADIVVLGGLIAIISSVFYPEMVKYISIIVWITFLIAIIALVTLMIFTAIALSDIHKSTTSGTSNAYHSTAWAFGLTITATGLILIGGIVYAITSAKKKNAKKELDKELFVAKTKLKARELMPQIKALRDKYQIPLSSESLGSLVDSIPSSVTNLLPSSIGNMASIGPVGLGYLGPPTSLI